MLSIQPNYSTQTVRKMPVFKGEDSSGPIDDKLYQSKKDYYEGQRIEFENIINDENTIKPLKKAANVFKIISGVLLEGWAVAWGASKGASFVKSSVKSGMNSEFAKGAKNVLKPLGKGLVAAGEQLAKLAKSAVETFKGTSLYTKMNENFTAIITKMDSNKYGKVVMDILRNVGHGIKVAAGYITKPLKEFAQKVKDTPFDTAYDKTAKAASTTLGVGAGLTSGYNEVMHPEDAVVEEDKTAENKDDISYSDIDEDDEVEEEK